MMKNKVFTSLASTLVLLSATAVQATTSGDVNLLIYETDASLATRNTMLEVGNKISGIKASLIGQGQEFEGFGSKYSAVLPKLKALDPNALTVISDGRDVLMNFHHGKSSATTVTEQFVKAFEGLHSQHPGAVVVSAEAQCCVSALTYVAPGDYFTATGDRAARACFSGHDDCLWNGDDKATPWESFMKDLAKERKASEKNEDIYLNAGLMVGYAADLVRVMEKANIGEHEDDQAVLTDYMYRYPKELILDYGQELFGSNRADSCMMELDSASDRLVHKETQTSPLFVHSPGGSNKCHDDLSDALEQADASASSTKVRRRLRQWKTSHTSNYGKTCSSGYKLVSGHCVADWCRYDYKCPSNSERIPGRACYDNMKDCKCNSGYTLSGSYCKSTTSDNAWNSWW